MQRHQISFDGLIKQTTVIQYDDERVYVGSGGDQHRVPLSDVLSLSNTHNVLANRYFWRLEYRLAGTRHTVEFRTNTTLWNRDFPRFHARLTQVNPDAVRSPYRWWTM